MSVVGGPLLGTPGNDFLIGDANALSQGFDNYSNDINGGGGEDVLVGDLYDPFNYNTEGDVLRGGAGNDIIFGDTAPSLIGIASPWVGDPNWDSRTDGSTDNLYGDAGDDIIYGGGGGDLIYGGSGLDKLYGQSGTDWIEGGEGKDTIRGGDGNDTVYAGAGSDIVYGEAGNDHLYGEDFSSSAGDGADTIRGGTGNDDIRGGAGADKLYGESGDDWIVGGGLWSGPLNDLGDLCDGGTGNDTIDGSYGNDTIIGGAGKDTLTGGEGSDIFRYRATADSRGSGFDIITEFNSNGVDRIDLQAIDAIPGGADDAFTYRGGKAFTAAGQVRVTQDTVNFWTYVKVNTDTDLTPEMTIRLNGLVALDAADFIL